LASVNAWLEVLSWIKALFDAATLSADVRKAYQKHREEHATQVAARRASETYSSYSEEELQAISSRLKGCQDRFIAEGSGTQRVQCLCSVFDDLIEGNGGVIPHVDDWERIYRQVCRGKTRG
jgi:hypothetical protein